MKKKILSILIILFFAVSCNSHNNVIFSNTYSKIYKNSRCKPSDGFPQMIMVPFFHRATQIVPDCKTYPKHKTALALMVFYHKWQEYFGDDDYAVKELLNKVMIKWGRHLRTIEARGFNLHGEPITKATIQGIVETDTIIWVWQAYGKISETSLVHELVHISLKASIGTTDPDHEGDVYHGWTPAHTRMIEEAKDMLRAFNI